MKRIIVWIDSKDEDAEQVIEKVEKFLSSMRVSHKIIDVCEIRLTEDEK